jgi:hypothetical protein
LSIHKKPKGTLEEKIVLLEKRVIGGSPSDSSLKICKEDREAKNPRYALGPRKGEQKL